MRLKQKIRYRQDRGILENRGRRLSEGIKHRDLGRVYRDRYRCHHRRPITTKTIPRRRGRCQVDSVMRR